MINFESTNGRSHSAELDYFDIRINKHTLDVYITTNRGIVKYLITSAFADGRDLESQRDAIAAELNKVDCKVKEEGDSTILFNDSTFNGQRRSFPFFQN